MRPALSSAALGSLRSQRASIMRAIGLGAESVDVLEFTVAGLREHPATVIGDLDDARHLDRLYQRLTTPPDEPTLMAALDDDPPDDADDVEPGEASRVDARPVRKPCQRTTQAMTVRLAPPMWRQVRDAARARQTTTAALIRDALTAYLDQEPARA